MTVTEELNKFYQEVGSERVGFLLRSGRTVEVNNVAENPSLAFVVIADDILPIEEDIVASWHTHPGLTSNLSGEDYITFQNWPDWKHFIIGKDGVACYSVSGSGAIMRDASSDCPSWEAENSLP